MNRIDPVNVYEFVTGNRSTQTQDMGAAGIAAHNARSWRSVGTACPGLSTAPPRPVGVRE
jgi:hypothetical protein